MVDNYTAGILAQLKAVIAARKVPALIGAPGTGKTATIHALAKEMDYTLIPLVASQMDPSDVLGLPKAESFGSDEAGREIYGTTFLAPRWQLEALLKKRVIIFLDEYSNAAPSTKAAFLTFIQDRVFPNGNKLPDEAIIIVAANPAEEAADGVEWDLPTANRLIFFPWSPSHDSWYEGMETNWGKPCSENELKWKKKIVKFIKESPTWLHRQPEEVGNTASFGIRPNDASAMEVLRSAWPSRRSWDNLSVILSHAPEDAWIQDNIAQGAVGYAAAAEFRSFLMKDNTIDPALLIANPDSVDWKTFGVDEANLVLREIVEEMVTAENSIQVLDLFIHIAKKKKANLAGAFIQELLKRIVNRSFPSDVINRNMTYARKNLIPAYREVLANAGGAAPQA